MAALQTPLTLRAALLTDRSAMVSLLTTKVSGVSPLDELVTDYGAAQSFSLADLQQNIQSGMMQVVVCLDKNAVLRGWTLFSHNNLLGQQNIIVPDAWEVIYAVTDKTLVLNDRLIVFQKMCRAAATTLVTSTAIWGDVRTPGNLDTFITSQSVFSLAATVTRYGKACHRWWGTAQIVLAKF